jgi:hypothetical protein
MLERRCGVNRVDIIRGVRRSIAAAVLAVFASLAAIDAVCCPDGCTHQQNSMIEQHHFSVDSGTCLFCVGAVNSSDRHRASHSLIVSDKAVLPPAVTTPDPPTDPLDHPPRT